MLTKEKKFHRNTNLVALVVSSSRERELETLGHVSIIESSPSGIRQDLVGLLDQDKPLGVLIDPTGRRHVRVVLPGELLVRLLDLHQGSGLGYAQKLVEAQPGGGLFRHEPIVDGGPGLGPERPRRSPGRGCEFDGEEARGGEL